MPIKGQKLENPATGDVYEFLETATDTAGKQVRVRITLKSKGALVPNHLHTFQDEKFEVLSGHLTVFSEGRKYVLTPGEAIDLPKGKAHNHYNEQNEPTVYIQTVSPALDFEHLLETIVGLSRDGKMPNGKAGLIQELVLLRYIDSKSVLADIPLGIQKILLNTLAPIGRLLGYRAVYKKYSGIEK
jgi:quercetin dioxygenase-like cupin family protein